MLVVVLLCALVTLTSQQCLTSRDEIRRVSESALESLQRSELEFTTDLARVVSTQELGQNIFFSPTSVFRALFLSYFLAANHTEADLRTALHLTDNMDKLDYLGAYNLEVYYQKLRSIKRKGCEMNIVNRLYTAKNLRVKQCFRVLFSDELQQANFDENVDGVRRKINHWVASQTNNVIKDFLSEDALTSETQLVLLNAAYFKGTWKTEFNKENTHQGSFYLNNGTKVNTTMMVQENRFNLREDMELGAEVLELPYKSGTASMFLVMPFEVTDQALQNTLQKIDRPALERMFATESEPTGPFEISVTLPKFTMEKTLDLTGILQKMGMGDLFRPTADLSTLTGSSDISFSDAIHKAKVRVDEKGTEAAASTSFVSARMGKPTFVANHPFIFLICDKASKKLLFFGVFTSPPVD